jgi:hypothetical protein
MKIDVEKIGFTANPGMDHVAVPYLVGQRLWCVTHSARF